VTVPLHKAFLLAVAANIVGAFVVFALIRWTDPGRRREWLHP
jgi:hypothetical protein